MKLWTIFLSLFIFAALTEVESTSNSVPLNFQNQYQEGRPSFHFRPPRNWINDPNGPMFYNGVYHLFYQYNPYAAEFNSVTMEWGHAVSWDLINWVYLQSALVPSEPYDINSCYTGSVTILPTNIPVILYTGVDARYRQVLNLATPKNLSDPLLQYWVKFSGNPLMTPPQGVKPDDFRDPSTGWLGKDGVWRVVIGVRRYNIGTMLLLRSKDFRHWSLHDDPLYLGTDNSAWECPDFFPVLVNSKDGVDTSAKNPNLKYVVKASFNSRDYYSVGKFIFDEEKFIPDDSGITGSNSNYRYDYGVFYASKTFFDRAERRRILWGWVQESDDKKDDIKKGWAGIQAIPRQVFLSAEGKQLVQWPIKELEKLHAQHITYKDKKLPRHSLFEVSGVTASQVDVEVSFTLPKVKYVEPMDPKWRDPQLLCSTNGATFNGRGGPFGLLVMASGDLREQTAVLFRAFRLNVTLVLLMCSDQSRSSLNREVQKTMYGAFIYVDPGRKMISLRSLVDQSVVESFGDEGRACITARVYPEFLKHEEAHLYVFNNGSLDLDMPKLDAWSMRKASQK